MMRMTVRPERFDNMWIAHSDDDGITWSPPRRTDLWGYPPDLLQLQDGRVLAVYGYRAEPMGVRGCVSENGLDWDLAAEFTICGCVGGPPGRSRLLAHWLPLRGPVPGWDAGGGVPRIQHGRRAHSVLADHTVSAGLIRNSRSTVRSRDSVPMFGKST